MDSDEAIIGRKLVSRILHGDGGAETELVERYSRGLLTLLRRRSGDAMLAEDLHQDCLTIVLTRLRKSGLDEPDKLVRFIHRTATNLLIAHNRKLARRRTMCDSDSLVGVADDSVSPADNAERKQVAVIVRELLKELNVERDRVLLTRFYLDQDDKDQICSDLHVSGEHFNRVLFRARGRFRHLLERNEKRLHLRVVQ